MLLPRLVDRRGDFRGGYLGFLGPSTVTAPTATPCLRLVCRLEYAGVRFGAPRRAQRPWVGDFYAADAGAAFRQVQRRFAGGGVRTIEVVEVEDLRQRKDEAL